MAYGFLAVANARHVYVKKRTTSSKLEYCKPWIIQRPVRGIYSRLFSELTNMDEPVIGCQEQISREKYAVN